MLLLVVFDAHNDKKSGCRRGAHVEVFIDRPCLCFVFMCCVQLRETDVSLPSLPRANKKSAQDSPPTPPSRGGGGGTWPSSHQDFVGGPPQAGRIICLPFVAIQRVFFLRGRGHKRRPASQKIMKLTRKA